MKPNVVIDGIEYNYHVTRDGRVFSLNYNKTGEVKELKTNTNNKDGYNRVRLSYNGIAKNFRVARLVALAYISNPDNKPEVDHINRVCTDDRAENLRWVTRSENSTNRNKFISCNKLNYGKSKPVRCIETGVIYPSVMEVQRQLRFSQGHISQCCRGERKTAYGFHWEYV